MRCPGVCKSCNSIRVVSNDHHLSLRSEDMAITSAGAEAKQQHELHRIKKVSIYTHLKATSTWISAASQALMQ